MPGIRLVGLEMPGIRLLGLMLAGGLIASTAQAGDELARGEYLVRAGGCVSCHTAPDGGEFLAGGRAIESPFGVFYGPNITPHRDQGIGSWGFEDFRRAMHEGRRPDGRAYYPAFPYTAYTRVRLEDLRAMWAYLQSVEPVERPSRDHDLAWYVSARRLLGVWRWRHFEAGRFEPDPERDEQWNRGAYLARALGHCAECHSPRTRTGGIDADYRYAGVAEAPDGDRVPNITPHQRTGIGEWSARHVARYLQAGLTPDGDFAGGSMADVIDDGTRHLDSNDLRAIAEYLLSLEPIEHELRE